MCVEERYVTLKTDGSVGGGLLVASRVISQISHYLKAVDCPELAVVEVCVPPVHGEVRMSKCAPRSVERVSITVFPFLKAEERLG